MDLKNNAMLAWGVAVVLGLLLVITLIANMGESVNWGDVGDKVREECRDMTEEGREDCMRSLGRMEEILHEVNRDLSEAATTTGEVPAPATQ